jgi:aminodeoxychorismate lyase
MIPLDDRGLLLGDGLFETVLARAGDLVALEAHLERMGAGCAVLGLPAPDPAAAEALMRQALAGAGLQASRAAVRLTLTAGSGGRGLDRPADPAPRLFATAAASQLPTTPARLVTSSIRRNADSPASRLKTLAYLDNVLARREAAQAGADEALMLNTRGEVAGAAAANIFWIQGEALFTPALECGVLAGIARAQVMARAEALGVQTIRVRAQPEELARAQAVFLTNSLIGVRAVSVLDGAAFAPSPLAEQLAEAMA